MIKAPIPANDYLRVRNLQELNILNTPAEEEFTNIVRLVSSVCKVPIAMISLVDDSREWFKAKVGTAVSEVNRENSFCGHAIADGNHFFQVEDMLKDVRFFDNPMVISSPAIRFYAGVQLVSRKGFNIGMLCVNDIKPNSLNKEQIFALQVLADCVIKLLDLRILYKEADEKNRKIQFQDQMQQRLLSIIAHDAELYQQHRVSKTTRK
jgi:GAF domain-containing protein